jgi:hypothetical protein
MDPLAHRMVAVTPEAPAHEHVPERTNFPHGVAKPP